MTAQQEATYLTREVPEGECRFCGGKRNELCARNNQCDKDLLREAGKIAFTATDRWSTRRFTLLRSGEGYVIQIDNVDYGVETPACYLEFKTVEAALVQMARYGYKGR